MNGYEEGDRIRLSYRQNFKRKNVLFLKRSKEERMDEIKKKFLMNKEEFKEYMLGSLFFVKQKIKLFIERGQRLYYEFMVIVLVRNFWKIMVN